jgi:hypothetical protein
MIFPDLCYLIYIYIACLINLWIMVKDVKYDHKYIFIICGGPDCILGFKNGINTVNEWNEDKYKGYRSMDLTCQC